MDEAAGGQDLQLTLDSLASIVPPDDAGAETAARYRYQAEIVARDAIAVLAAGRGAVVCEWQEDAIVIRPETNVELVSVKHRELSQGPWNRRSLIRDGGVKHLFERWLANGKRPRCRLSTNAGLAADARRLHDVCASQDAPSIASMATEVSAQLGGSDADAELFLAALRIEFGLPSRNYITAVNTTQVMAPALQRMGLPSLDPVRAYEAIVGEVEAASRDQGRGSTDFLEVIADPRRLDELMKRERRVAERTLLPSTLRDAVARARRTDRVRLARATSAGGTALEQKLRAGGLGPTLIRSAQILRANWTAFEATYADPLGDDEDLADFAGRLTREAGAAEAEAMNGRDADGTYGRAMYGLLRNRLDGLAVGAPGSISSDTALAEAYVFELTDRCEIWWSPEFELVRP